MTNNQITALAREYGEYVANSLDYDMCPDPELRYRLVVKGHSESAQSVLEWLLRRYCLVEKEAVRKEYQQAIEQGKHAHVKCHVESRAKLRLLKSLFPELRKEVEP